MVSRLDKREFFVDPLDVGLRIDRWLGDTLEEMTRSGVQKLCEDGFVLVGGKPVNKNYKLRLKDNVTVILPEAKILNIAAQNIPITIVYEDDDLLVVNKPKGMVVHPAPGNYDGTLVNALLYHCEGRLSSINGVIRPGIVHRIDKDTSGLLIVAKNDHAHTHLGQQIKAHSFTRIYNGVVYGRFSQESGVIDAPIGRNPADRKKMCVTEKNSRCAVTHYQVLEPLKGFTHLRFTLETGRTHQIRVHMAFVGHPIAGDPAYGPKKVITQLNGQCLHARTIGFVHPTTGKYMEFTSELPPYYTDFLKSVKLT